MENGFNFLKSTHYFIPVIMIVLLAILSTGVIQNYAKSIQKDVDKKKEKKLN
jgi:hypothetical protein